MAAPPPPPAPAPADAAAPAPAAAEQPQLSPKSSSTYSEDVVEYTAEDGSRVQAVVTRCWADEQSPETAAEASRLNIPFTPLRPGYLEVLHPSGQRSELLESLCTVVDKGFLRGDLVRLRSASSKPGKKSKKTQLGQITALKTKVKLQRVITGEELEGWHDADLLVAAARVNRGDHVVHGEWVGLVEEVFEMAMIEAGNAGLVRRVCDTGTSLSVGSATEAIKAMLQERGEGFLASFLGASDLKTILEVKQLVVAVNWLCKNQQLAPDSVEGESWERPKRYWTDVGELKLVRATADHLHTIHDKVVFRDPTLHPTPPSRFSTQYPSGHAVLVITSTRTTSTVLWQDGSTSTLSSAELEQVPPGVDEETDVFPGDVGVFSGVSPSRVGVVQSMDARKRTIRIKYLPPPSSSSSSSTPAAAGAAQGGGDEEEDLISALEFDPHGPPPDAYGVRRGDWVLVTREGDAKGNGADWPTVPGLGESETLAGLMPSGEELRMELSTLGLAYAHSLSDTFQPPAPQTSPEALASIKWYGEVWDLLLSGRALLRFPDGTFEEVPVERLVHLDDGLDPETGMMAPPVGEDGLPMEEDEEGASEDGSWMTDEEGEEGEEVWVEGSEGSEGSEEGEDEDGDVEMKGWADEEVEALREEEADERRRNRGWADEEEEEEQTEAKPAGEKDAAATAPAPVAEPAESISSSDAAPPADATSSSSSAPAPAPAPAPTPASAPVSMPTEVEDFADWSRFEVLEESPADHHYASEPVQVPGKAFMSRVRKEHGVLAGALPPNILVRAYENRLDLLRCLIVGPTDTPFANAPFLFDVFLSPSKFPQEPPQVYFHSWAGGTRVSPNLYAEGKVCLSLLGTWSGDKTESWSAARSSILQVFVSIQALIMVEHPYFTEPGFEKQIGTPEGTAASELYNERTLVLTRAFVKRACEFPPSNFAREIAAYYYTGLPGTASSGDGEEQKVEGKGKGALEGIIEQSRRLLEESERWHAEQDAKEDEAAEGEGEEEQDRRPPPSAVVPSQRILTEGAGLSLRRTLKALEELKVRGPKGVEEES
ncbi:hypothetical protein JCM6882_001820 [Rhodosporidiobolus microsporus]